MLAWLGRMINCPKREAPLPPGKTRGANIIIEGGKENEFENLMVQQCALDSYRIRPADTTSLVAHPEARA